MLKGVLHCHSTYSDGEFTLAELRDTYVLAGCRFACVSDHADSFDAETLARYRHECERRSDAAFRFIAGLEYTCRNRMHVLGYGTTAIIPSIDPEEVIREIRAAGGVAVIAHPRDDAFAWIETFATLPDGIETWNSKYDGRYAPRPGTFALLGRLQARRPEMTAFYGQDLHWRTQYRALFTAVACETPKRESVIEALKRGDYVGIKDRLQLPSSGVLPQDLMARFAREQTRSQSLRRWLRQGKALADGIGVALPSAIKAQLRRIF